MIVGPGLDAAPQTLANPPFRFAIAFEVADGNVGPYVWPVDDMMSSEKMSSSSTNRHAEGLARADPRYRRIWMWRFLKTLQATER